MSENRNILIVGMAKTGTTALYRWAQGPFSEDHGYYWLYEPTRAWQLRNLEAYGADWAILTKVMLAAEERLCLDYGHFPLKVLVVRDPRDAIVSQLLFRPLGKARYPMYRVRAFASAVRVKEARPGAISVMRLHRFASSMRLGSYVIDRELELMHRVLGLAETGAFEIVRYEDFIDGNHASLFGYLGIEKGEEVEGGRPEVMDYIHRSSEHGYWRDWLTPSDVDYLAPKFDSFIRTFGYGHDWSLRPRQHLEPEVGSRHILVRYPSRVVSYQIETFARPASTPEEFAIAQSLARNGHPEMAHSVAEHFLNGTFGAPDHAAGFGFGLRGAMQGHRPSMALVAELLFKGVGCDRDEAAAALWRHRASDVLAPGPIDQP